ncbi:hypothetical protein GCM10025734_19250 [Kitasatospora paranensis]
MLFGVDVEQRGGGGGQVAECGGPDGVRGDGVELRGEPGEQGGDLVRVEAEQPDAGGGGAVDGLVRGEPGGVGGGEGGGAGGEAEDDGVVGAAGVPSAEPVEVGVRPGCAGGPEQLAAEPAAGGPQGRCGGAGVGGLVEGVVVGAGVAAAAASAAAVRPVVCRRPVRNAPRLAASWIRPALTAASAPPEWACPPAGNRPSARSSRAAVIRTGSTAGRAAVRWRGRGRRSPRRW